MQFPHIDPVFLRIGPLQFRWYGLMYIIGFAAAYSSPDPTLKESVFPSHLDDISDLIFFLAVGLIIGARLGYAFFYNFSFYFANPSRSWRCGKAECPSTAGSSER